MVRIFSLLFVLLALSLQGQGIEFIHEDLTRALEEAKKQDKLVFVDAYTTWCGPCKRMAKNIFTQSEAGKFYNERFVNLKLDMEKGDGIEFSRTYRISSYPTLLFIDSEGELIYKSIGAKPLDEFIQLGETALKTI